LKLRKKDFLLRKKDSLLRKKDSFFYTLYARLAFCVILFIFAVNKHVMKDKNQEPNVIVYATQKYTALEKDVVSLIINQLDSGMNVQPDLFKNKTITVSAKMLDMDSNQYSKLKRAALSLKKKEIQIIDDEKQEFDLITPFPRIKYRSGVLEITMLADVLPHFLELKNGYTEYYLKESLSLGTFRPKRLYELLSSRKKLFKPTWKVYDEELKAFFNIKPTSYTGRPSEFEEKQVSPFVEEINEKTSLIIKYKRDKDEGGWFTFFEIKEKPKIAPEQMPERDPAKLDEKSLRCYKGLKNLGVRDDLIWKIVQTEQLQKDFWKWVSQHRDDVKNKKWGNPAGVLLVHLGLAEAKV